MLSRIIVLIALALLGGCTTIARFTGDELPSSELTGEKECQVPQFWKALALKKVNTHTLARANVVQVRVPPEWLGDTLGSFVESEGDLRSMEHYPRLSWQALVVDQRGKRQFFPAAMKNPLDPAPSQGMPVLTVVIPDGVIPAGEEVDVYVLSGAFTRLLTTTGDLLRLPSGLDCLGVVDAEFLRSFPSKATVLPADQGLISSLRADFPLITEQEDGYYSHSRLGFNERVVGEMRQVRQGERVPNKGAQFAPLDPISTGISTGIALSLAASDEYLGPFGERLYSVGEARAALGFYLKGYNTLKGKLEAVLQVPTTKYAAIVLDFHGRKTGWEIGQMMEPQVVALWRVLDSLKYRFLRTQEKGAPAMKEATQPGLLPSSSP